MSDYKANRIEYTSPSFLRVDDVDYTIYTVPPDIKDRVIVDGLLYVDVINAGPRVGSGLNEREAKDRGLIKNHLIFRSPLDFGYHDGLRVMGQARFGMDAADPDSIGSNEGQYAVSYRSDPGVGSDIAYSPVGSLGKPSVLNSPVTSLNKHLAPDRDESVEAALPLVPATGDGSHGYDWCGSYASHASYTSQDSQAVVLSDVESLGKPPNIASSDGGFFQQPIEGTPYPSDFNIKIRGWDGASNSTVVSFQLALAPGTTFGELLDALVARNMLPFFFRRINAAYLGCRDFISQSIATWLDQKFLVSTMAVIVCSDPAAARDVEIDDFDIRSLICWRYTNPLVRIDSDTDVVSGAIIATRRSLERTHNFIDRAVWPAGFTHEEHPKLLYNQLIVAPASRDTPNVAAITHDIDKTDDTRDSPKVPAPTDNSDDHHDGEVGEDSKDSNTNNDIPVV